MPGKSELLAQRFDLRRDDAEVLGDERQVLEPSADRTASNSDAPGPFTHAPSIAVEASAGTSQDASKPRK